MELDVLADADRVGLREDVVAECGGPVVVDVELDDVAEPSGSVGVGAGQRLHDQGHGLLTSPSSAKGTGLGR